MYQLTSGPSWTILFTLLCPNSLKLPHCELTKQSAPWGYATWKICSGKLQARHSPYAIGYWCGLFSLDQVWRRSLQFVAYLSCSWIHRAPSASKPTANAEDRGPGMYLSCIRPFYSCDFGATGSCATDRTAFPNMRFPQPYVSVTNVIGEISLFFCLYSKNSSYS